MSLQTRFDQLEEDIISTREENKEWILDKDNEWPHPSDYLFESCPITFDAYQMGTSWSSCRNPKNIPADLYFAVGLGEETGETLSIIKKKYRDNGGILTDKKKEKLLGELSDVLYYLSSLARVCDIKMSDVAKFNQKKMLIRLKEHNEKINNSNNNGISDNGRS